MDYRDMRRDLAEALRLAPYQQLELLRITDQAFAYLEAHEDQLNDDQVLELRILLAQAETMLGRYFGS